MGGPQHPGERHRTRLLQDGAQRRLASGRGFDQWVRTRTPAGRWGNPEELVGAALFLASPASDFVNGQVIYVDGGVLASI
jgi:gluconate 5-dehydrogenase